MAEKLDYSKSIRSVTVELVQAGQPRAYADSVYEAYITFSVPEGSGWASKIAHSPEKADYVKQYIPLLVHSFKEKGERQWHEPWLEKLEMVEPGRWHVIVKSPFLD